MSAEAPRLRDVASGAVWVVAGRIAADAMRVFRLAALARLLDPVDIGQAAAALAVIGAADAATGIGTEVALLQTRLQRPSMLSAALVLGIGRGALLGLVIAATSPFAAAFFRDDSLAPLVACAGLCGLARGVNNPGTALLASGLRFKRLSTLDVVDAVVGLTLGVVLALAGAGAWALVVSTVAGLAARSAVSYVVAPRFDLTIPAGADIKALASFGRWVAGTGLLHYVAIRGDQILVGRMLGNGPLGLYSVSHRLSEAPMFALFEISRVVVAPYLSRVAHDRARLRRGFVWSLGTVAVASSGLCIALAVFAPQLLALAFGPAWIPAAPAARLIAVATALRVMVQMVSWLAYAANEPARVFRLNAVRAVVMMTALIPLTLRYDLTGAALAVLLGVVATVPLAWMDARALIARPVPPPVEVAPDEEDALPH